MAVKVVLHLRMDVVRPAIVCDGVCSLTFKDCNVRFDFFLSVYFIAWVYIFIAKPCIQHTHRKRCTFTHHTPQMQHTKTYKHTHTVLCSNLDIIHGMANKLKHVHNPFYFQNIAIKSFTTLFIVYLTNLWLVHVIQLASS